MSQEETPNNNERPPPTRAPFARMRSHHGAHYPEVGDDQANLWEHQSAY